MRRVIVFGSTGMVGRAVVKRLRGWAGELVTRSRSEDGFDVTGASDIHAAIRGADCAVNCIGLLRSGSVPDRGYHERAALVNGVWPHTLARLAAGAGCRVLHLSTDAVFPPGKDEVSEDTPVGPAEVYGLSKALGEVVGVHCLTVRLSVIGPAPDRGQGLWEWLLRQPSGARVRGYVSPGWAGCASNQVADLVADLIDEETFSDVRSISAVHHFVPNGLSSKFEVLRLLASQFRPDIDVAPVVGPATGGPPLGTVFGALGASYSGVVGWERAFDAYKRGDHQ